MFKKKTTSHSDACFLLSLNCIQGKELVLFFWGGGLLDAYVAYKSPSNLIFAAGLGRKRAGRQALK